MNDHRSLSGKRILMISYTSFLQKLYQTLPRIIATTSGAEVKVLVPPYWKEIWSRGRKPLEKTHDEDYDIVQGRILCTGNLHFAFFRDTLSGLLRSFRPDIIDLDNEPFNAGSFQLTLLARRILPQARLVLHASQHQFKKYPPPFNWFESYVLGHIDAVLVRNRMAREVLLGKGFRGRLELITHGVDTDIFKPEHPSAPKRQIFRENLPVVGYVGALAEHKGVHILLEASAGLGCHLLLVGDGPERGRLEAQAGQLGLSVSFVSSQDHEAIAGYMNMMDIMVLPSLTKPNWIEKFGRVLIEAMATGTPVIGSSSGEIPHVLGDAGLVFREGDAADLRARMQQMLESPERRREHGERGRRRVLRNYAWEVIAGRTLKVYDALLRETG